MSDVNELMSQALEAAKAGDRERAKQLLQEVVEEDEENIKAWLLLARVTENDDERRICLTTVLQLEPGHAAATEMLAKLDAKLGRPPEDEIYPGIPRRVLRLVVLACGVFGVFVCIVVFTIAGGINSGRANETATVVAFYNQATAEQADREATLTQIAFELTEEAIAATQVELTRNPPPTETPDLPPTWTPSPTPEDTSGALPPLDPPPALPGTIVGWGGRSFFNNEFRDIRLYSIPAEGRFRTINTDAGLYPAIHPTGQRVMYMRYSSFLNSWTLYAVNIDNTQTQDLGELVRDEFNIDEPQMPAYSPDGQQVLFVAKMRGTDNDQLFLLNTVNGVTARLTSDDASYSYPAFGPRGDRVVFVRSSPTEGTDLYMIDLRQSGFPMRPLTDNLNSMIESAPSWAQDGGSSNIVYAAARPGDPNNSDIMLMQLVNDSPDTLVVLPLIATEADERYPVLSPDGRYVAFASNRSRFYDIYIFDRQTEELYQLTATDDPEFPGGWAPN